MILHKEILDFADRCVSTCCAARVPSTPARNMRLTRRVFDVCWSTTDTNVAVKKKTHGLRELSRG